MASVGTDLRRELNALAYQQSGYFSAAQAREIGYSYQAQKHHADAGNWTRIDHGLFRLPGWPTNPDDEYVRWTLWSRGKGIISHDSALRVHGLSDLDPAQIHLTVPPGFRRTDDHVVPHRGSVPASDLERRAGYTVTTPLRTLVDIAAGDLSQEIVDAAVADALREGLVTRRRLLRRTADAAARPALRMERALAKAVSDE